MIGNLLNVSVDVYRATFADDGAGGRTKTFAFHGTIRAAVSQASATERAAAAQLSADLTHVVYAFPDADVERGDELDAGGPERLRVRAVLTNSRTTYKRLDCEVGQSG